jgi:hypothetical protein
MIGGEGPPWFRQEEEFPHRPYVILPVELQKSTQIVEFLQSLKFVGLLEFVVFPQFLGFVWSIWFIMFAAFLGDISIGPGRRGKEIIC